MVVEREFTSYVRSRWDHGQHRRFLCPCFRNVHKYPQHFTGNIAAITAQLSDGFLGGTTGSRFAFICEHQSYKALHVHRLRRY